MLLTRISHNLKHGKFAVNFPKIRNPHKADHLCLRKMSAFIQKLNPLTGLNEWVIQNEDYDYHQEVARAAFADMLHDSERNQLYEQGLKAAIDYMHSRGKKANVLDIGTGTGLLSMMAARNGADTITACEAFEPMGKCALKIIELNGYKDKIRVIPKRSTDLKLGVDFQERMNVLVTEVFDTELIGEGGLSTFRHAHEHLLEQDCVVIPHKANMYAQVIESPLVTNWNRLKNVYDDELELLIKVPEERINSCEGTISLHDLQINQLPRELIRTLSEPVVVGTFDFSGKTKITYNRRLVNKFKAATNGQASAVFMWWDLEMDLKSEVILSCAPFWAHPNLKKATTENSALLKKQIPWRDHWMQAIYYFPKSKNLTKDDDYSLVFNHDEYSLWFDVSEDLNVEGLNINGDTLESPRCECGVHSAYSHTRIGMLNDCTRLKKYLSVIEKHANAENVALVLSHGSYPFLLLAKKMKWVYFLETNVLSRRLLEDFIKVNDLKNVEIISDATNWKPERKINFVIGEPFFVSSILPWDNLHFLYVLKDLKEHFTEDVQIFPKAAKIKGVPVEFENLHKIRAPLDICEGFQMKPFDDLILSSSCISDDNVEAQPLWEYPGKALSNAKELAEIKLEILDENFLIENQGVFNVKSENGSCNGIAIWVDWVFDDGDNPRKYTVTTGPVLPIEIGENISWDMHTRQGVCLLGHVNKLPDEMNYTFRFDFDKGDINFKINL